MTHSTTGLLATFQSSTLRPSGVARSALASPRGAETSHAEALDNLQSFKSRIPREFRLESGRLLETLAAHPRGLSTQELLCAFYSHYAHVSLPQRSSLNRCLTKLAQRARKRGAPHGVWISFDQKSKVWSLATAARAG